MKRESGRTPQNINQSFGAGDLSISPFGKCAKLRRNQQKRNTRRANVHTYCNCRCSGSKLNWEVNRQSVRDDLKITLPHAPSLAVKEKMCRCHTQDTSMCTSVYSFNYVIFNANETEQFDSLVLTKTT